MRRVGIKALKKALSKEVRAASAGGTILVTDRDRVVAALRPPSTAEMGDSAARVWAQMICERVVTASQPFTERPPNTQIMTFEELMADMDRNL